MAYQLAVRNALKHHFNNRTAGRKWLKGFLARHKELSLRQPTGTSFARVKALRKKMLNPSLIYWKRNLSYFNFHQLGSTTSTRLGLA